MIKGRVIVLFIIYEEMKFQRCQSNNYNFVCTNNYSQLRFYLLRIDKEKFPVLLSYDLAMYQELRVRVRVSFLTLSYISLLI